MMENTKWLERKIRTWTNRTHHAELGWRMQLFPPGGCCAENNCLIQPTTSSHNSVWDIYRIQEQYDTGETREKESYPSITEGTTTN